MGGEASKHINKKDLRNLEIWREPIIWVRKKKKKQKEEEEEEERRRSIMKQKSGNLAQWREFS